MAYFLKKLDTNDYDAYHELRMEALRTQEREFRSSVEDELNLSKKAVIERLGTDYIVGVYSGKILIGLGGLSRLLDPSCGIGLFCGGCMSIQITEERTHQKK